MPTQDDRTSYLSLKLPYIDNNLDVDVGRLREALTAIDAKFEALDLLLGSDDTTLDTVQELVNAIKDGASDIGDLLTGKADASHGHDAATGSADGFMSAGDKTKLDGVSLGLLFDEIEITPTAGQTTFTISGGYTVGCIQVFVNGMKMKSADFTATDGDDVVLASGLTTSDELVIVRFKRGLAA